VVDRLAKEGKQIEALSFAHAFGIMNRIQPVLLLKSYLKEARKTAQSILKNGNSSMAAQVMGIPTNSCSAVTGFFSFQVRKWDKRQMPDGHISHFAFSYDDM
jgi:hypothetical protein